MRVQGQRRSYSCDFGGLMATPPAGDGRGWLFSSPWVLSEAQEVMLGAKGRVEARPRRWLARWASLAGPPSQTGPLNTG